jgi:hypothetical protein
MMSGSPKKVAYSLRYCASPVACRRCPLHWDFGGLGNLSTLPNMSSELGDYVPFRSHVKPPESTSRIPRGRSTTGFGWALSLSPASALFLIGCPIFVGGDVSPWAWVAVPLLGWISGVWFAKRDRRELRARGYETAVSYWWALIPGLYLLLSGSKIFDQAHSGLRPAWIHLLTWFLLAIFALCVVAFGPSIFPNLDWIMTPPGQ